jgi:solute carrier family 24 (sodium/potassium/calcium exchanger), member 6
MLIRIDNFMPIWVLTIVISVFLFTITLVFTKWQQKPKYHSLFSWLGFFVSVMWIYKLSNEIVTLLTVI